MPIEVKITGENYSQVAQQLLDMTQPILVLNQLQQQQMAAHAQEAERKAAELKAAKDAAGKAVNEDAAKKVEEAITDKKPDKPLDGEVIPPARRTRAKKDDKPEQVDLEEAIAEKVEKVPPVEDLRNALIKMAQTDGFGTEAARKYLTDAGAQKPSEVPEDERAAIIASINKALEG